MKAKDLLAADVVGNGRYRAAADACVHVKRAFDLEHADVLAAAPHDGLLAIEEIHQPVFVGEDEVAGVEPAVLPRRFGGFLVLQIAAEESGAGIFALGADQQFAGFSRRDVGAKIVNEAILHAFGWPADAARAKAGRFARGGGGCRTAGLGHRPGLDDRDAVALLEGGAVADIDAGREGETHAVLPFHLGHRQLQQNGGDDAETMHDGRAAIGHALPPAVGMKAVKRNHGAAEHHHADRAAAERVHVKHRQRRQVDLAVRLQFGHAALREIPVGDLQEIAVREHAALGLAGAAGGEQQRAFAVELGILGHDVRLAWGNAAVGIDQAGASERRPLRHLHAI